MSIRPGSSVTSPRSMSSAGSSGTLSGIHRRDPVTLDHHHRRRAHLAGLDVGPARRAQDGAPVGLRHGTGSDTQSSVVAPESGTFGCFQHSTGNDTWIIE